MTIQTSYSENIGAARDGLVVGSDFNIDTGIIEDAAGIAAGKAVIQGSGAKGVKVTATLALFRGATVRDVTLAASATPDVTPQYGNVGVLTRGKIWVTVAEAVAVGNDVYFDSDGTWGDTNASGKVGPVLGARWASAAGSGERAILELSGFNQT